MSPRSARALAGREGDAGVLLREHLLDTADRLLAQGDVATITARALARAADVSDGVLYNHFADKNDVLLTALVRRFGRLVARFQAAAPTPGTRTVEENLEQLASSLLDLHSAAIPLIAKLLAQPALLERFLGDIHQPGEPFGGKLIRDLVVDYVAAEQRLGRLASSDAAAAADLLIGGVALLALPWAAAPRNDRLGALVATLLNGLCSHPDQRSTR
jgi:AcrR family transcriptional regulator